MERDKALEMAVSQIERQFGRGAIMKMGETADQKVEVISTGALALDLALGIGGVPRGRVVEIYGTESGGKCLTADTYVWTERGLETITEIFEGCGQAASCTSRVTDVSGLGVRLVNEDAELEPVTGLTHNNRRPVLRVALKSGRTVEVTKNHPLRVVNDHGWIVWREAGEIRLGDTVVSALFGAEQAIGGSNITEDEAVLLGYLVAEGTLTGKNRVAFTNWDPEVGDEFVSLVEGLFGYRVRCYDRKEYHVNSQSFRRLMAETYGLDYVAAAGKAIPLCIRTGGAKVQRAFLSALFEGDGWIDSSSTVGLGTASEELAKQVQLLLYGFGIPASVYSKFNKKYQRDYWSVIVNSSVAQRFMEEIGFRSARRRAQVEANFRPSRIDPQFENVPNMADLVRTLRDAVSGDRDLNRVVSDLFRPDMGLACSRSRLRQIVAWVDNSGQRLSASARAIAEYLRELSSSTYTYEEVIAVTPTGEKPTFDVVVPGTHSFLANGVLSHNTTLGLHIIAEAQRNGGIAAFIDAEHALDPGYAKAIGVDVDELLISQPDTGEQALEIADMLVRSGALDVIVIDSVAALVPRAEIEGEMGDAHVGLQARLMSQALRKLTGTLARSKTTAVFINQLREKIGVMFGSPEVTPGGRALKFYSSIRLEVRRIETIKEGTESIGNRTRVKVVKNKMAPPFRQAEFDIIFGEGISREGSLLDVAVDEGVVKKSGAWFTFDADQLGQGRENAKRFLRENPETAMQLQDKVFEAVGHTAVVLPASEEVVPLDE